MSGTVNPGELQCWKAKDRFGQEVIFKIPARYQIKHELESGAFGCVVAALDTQTGEEVAIKKITKALTNGRDVLKLLREVCIMKHLRPCEYIIHLQGAFQTPPEPGRSFGDVYICMELMANDLQAVIKGQNYGPEHVQHIMNQILLAVHAMHTAGIMHRDLKPQNILTNSQCDVKICDFGMSRNDHEDDDKSEYVVTRWYRAPELLMNWRQYGRAVDLFSVGCIFGELLGGKPMFQGRDYMDQLSRVIGTLGFPAQDDIDAIGSPAAASFLERCRRTASVNPQNLAAQYPTAPREAIDLMEKLLAFNPSKRITAREALDHEYFKVSLTGDEEDEGVYDGDAITDMEEIGEFDASFERTQTSLELLQRMEAELRELSQDVGLTLHYPSPVVNGGGTTNAAAAASAPSATQNGRTEYYGDGLGSGGSTPAQSPGHDDDEGHEGRNDGIEDLTHSMSVMSVDPVTPFASTMSFDAS